MVFEGLEVTVKGLDVLVDCEYLGATEATPDCPGDGEEVSVFRVYDEGDTDLDLKALGVEEMELNLAVLEAIHRQRQRDAEDLLTDYIDDDLMGRGTW